MSNKQQLSNQRINTIINGTSKYQEVDCNVVIDKLVIDLKKEFGVNLENSKNILLKDIVSSLREDFPDIKFHYYFDKSNMRPDGGILYLVDKKNHKYPILITEVKNQGTNDRRTEEGKPLQAMGNAIERLGKNVIGFRTFLLNESIFPFVCFGYGYDFNDNSSILDRVATIAMFGELNTTHLHNDGLFNRGSYYFRQDAWTPKEMYSIMYDISKRSIQYYYSKYGEKLFN